MRASGSSWLSGDGQQLKAEGGDVALDRDEAAVNVGDQLADELADFRGHRGLLGDDRTDRTRPGGVSPFREVTPDTPAERDLQPGALGARLGDVRRGDTASRQCHRCSDG